MAATDYPWCPVDRVAVQLGVDLDAAGELPADVEAARLAACAYVERAQPGPFVEYDDDGDGTVDRVVYEPGQAVVHGALLLTSRLHARRGSPQGVASFGEFGATTVLRLDPDVERLLGVGRYSSPRVG